MADSASKTVLITGAAGYVGRPLVEAALAAGYRVIALVHRSTPAGWSDREGLTVRSADITQPLSNEGLDRVAAVVHLAGVSWAPTPAALHTLNVEGTRRVLALAETLGATHFLYVSSQDAVAPVRTAYGDSKRAAEALVQAGSVPFTVLRPPLVVGETGGALDRVVAFARRWGVCPLPGGGRQYWQPVYRETLVALILRLLATGPQGREAVNAGGAEPRSQRAVFAEALAAAGVHARFLPLPRWSVRCLAAGLTWSGWRGRQFAEKLRLNAMDRRVDVRDCRRRFGLPPDGGA